MAPLSDDERRSFLEVCDDRYGRRSTVLTSQLPVESWHAQIGDPTIADSILDRLVHNAYRIEMNGESIRKKKKKRRHRTQPEAAHERPSVDPQTAHRMVRRRSGVCAGHHAALRWRLQALRLRLPACRPPHRLPSCNG
jgi:hypothetical protein